MAGAKMADNNPGIADLSDSQRPLKLAEQYTELYDNEWTDILEYFTDERELDDRFVIDQLLGIMMVSF